MNKRMLSLILSFVMIFGIIVTPIPAYAEDPSTCVFSVEADKTVVTTGETTTITYTVYVEQVGQMTTIGFTLSIPEGLTYVDNSGSEAENIKSTLGWDEATWVESSKYFSGFGSVPYEGSEKLALVTFQCTVNSDASIGNYEVTIVDPDDPTVLPIATDENYELKEITVTPATVTIEAAPCKHETTKAVEAQAPTCTSDGVKAHFVCQNEECGALLDAEGNVLDADKIVDPALGHKMEKTEAKAPTCTEPGNNAYFTCEICGKVFRDEAGDTATTVEEETIAVDPTAHKLTSVEAQDATCTADGWTAYEKCDSCGKLFNASGEEITEEDVVIPAAHTYGELVPAAEAVHSQTELKPAVDAHYICSECGKYFTEAKAETTLEELTGETPEHTYGDWQTTAENHWKECSCGLKADEGAHVYDNDEDMKCNTCDYDRSCKHDGETTTVAAKASTCKTQGNAEYVTCNACGAVIEGSADKLPLDPANHEVELAHTEAKEPDCENAGNVEYWSCSACEKNFSDAEGTVVIDKTAVDALGHKMSDWEVTTAPNCTEKGVETRTCLNECGKTETREVAALGHTEVIDEAVAPTCKDSGLTEGKHCSVCDEVLVAQKVVEATGAHVDADGKWETDGENHWHTCGCGTEFDKAQHIFAEATCTAPKTCSVCGTTEGEALGHDIHFIEKVEPTCTEEGGNAFYHCYTCHKVFKDEAATTPTNSLEVILPALGHDLGEWYQTKEPTEDEEGEERRDCSRCDYFETNVLDALGTPFMDEWYWTMMMVHNQKFEIEADADGGEISPAGVSKVKFGTSITYTITPDEGYEIETVFVDGKDIGAVSEYTFKRVTKDHTIYAVCSEIEEEPVIGDEIVSTYVDVDVDDWFYDAVAFVTEEGLMNGTGDKLFSPDNATTRAMIVTILWRLEGEPEAAPSAFTDVEEDMWYTAAIDWAAENGIVNGYEDGTFGPARNITREQVMAIFHRYAAYKGIADDLAVSMLPQYDCSVWAENDVNWADMNGLLDNIGVDIFDMTAEANRAEIAAYLANFCGYIG